MIEIPVSKAAEQENGSEKILAINRAKSMAGRGRRSAGSTTVPKW